MLTIQKLRASVAKHFTGLLDETSDDILSGNCFDVEEAIYWYAEQNHSGQSSDLYLILCASEFEPGPVRTFDKFLEEQGIGLIVYDYLSGTFFNYV